MIRKLAFVVFLLCATRFAGSQGVAGRVPAIPLIVHDPYFSIWSTTDSLFSGWPKHWTGRTNGMCAMLRVDGRSFRLMGESPSTIPPARQVERRITPTRTTYEFSAGGVRLSLSFLCTQLPDGPRILSRPVSYLDWEVRPEDSRAHAVEVYFDVSAEAAVNTPDQSVIWSRYSLPSLQVLRIGSQNQPILEREGDDCRIDWGYLYLAAREQEGVVLRVQGHDACRSRFVATGKLPSGDDLRCPRAANDNWPVLAVLQEFPPVSEKVRHGGIVLAYDDLFALQYFQRNLPAYWREGDMNIESLLIAAFSQADSLRSLCREFDREFLKDALACGGEEYQELATLAYRQCLAANKIVADIDGSMLMFPKENFSNGCIGTVDVIYPASPLFLLFNPALLKAQLKPLMDYAALPRWKFPFAPHDLGTYPHANGQVYGGGEQTADDQMPVEESGNMILMVAGVAAAEGSPKFALEHWTVLRQWAEYLKGNGFDPENQLCTDDFAGHLAHNVNLSAKAILALGAYSKLCTMAHKEEEAGIYRHLAEQYAAAWIKKADDGGHTRLAFDAPGTWSQKYNLVWDRILDLNLFPTELLQKEILYYRSKQNKYGLPLDNRETYTKLDWITWTASLAASDPDFRAFIAPVVRMLRETPDRVPMTDWYWTTTAKKAGFQARSVVGGVLVKMLLDREVAGKWQRRARR
jgi:hypothetical protein